MKSQIRGINSYTQWPTKLKARWQNEFTNSIKSNNIEVVIVYKQGKYLPDSQTSPVF